MKCEMKWKERKWAPPCDVKGQFFTIYERGATLCNIISCLNFSVDKMLVCHSRMLLKKLFQYLPMTESQALQSTAALKSLAANFHGNLPPTVLGPVPPSENPPTQYSKKKEGKKYFSGKRKKEARGMDGF